MMRLYLIFILFLLMAACSEEEVLFVNFFDRIDQAVTTRNVSAGLTPEQMLNLTDYEIYAAAELVQNTSHLFLLDFRESKVVKISKSDLSDVEIWNLSEGEGPGEVLSVRGFSADDERVLIGDPRNYRIVELTAEGNHIRDLNVTFSPDKFVLAGNGQLINNSPIQQPDLFTVYEPEADSLTGFEEGEIPMEDAMKYMGYLTSDQDHVFYSGYSEPLLRKYTTDGDLIFSRSTIDNPDTDNNYENHSSGETIAYGFSEDAVYSTFGLTVFEHRLFIIPHHNSDENFRYLDIYDSDNGDYKESWELDEFPLGVAVDRNRIYTLGRNEEGDYLVKWYNHP